jgi:bisphosphoglycerate-dependent phosphoglycerate mutase
MRVTKKYTQQKISRNRATFHSPHPCQSKTPKWAERQQRKYSASTKKNRKTPINIEEILKRAEKVPLI